MVSKVLLSELDEDGREKGGYGEKCKCKDHLVLNWKELPAVLLPADATTVIPSQLCGSRPVAHLQRIAGLCFSTTRARQVTIRSSGSINSDHRLFIRYHQPSVPEPETLQAM